MKGPNRVQQPMCFIHNKCKDELRAFFARLPIPASSLLYLCFPRKTDSQTDILVVLPLFCFTITVIIIRLLFDAAPSSSSYSTHTPTTSSAVTSHVKTLAEDLTTDTALEETRKHNNQYLIEDRDTDIESPSNTICRIDNWSRLTRTRDLDQLSQLPPATYIDR